jgi:3-oxoacyl-[acyl-carrier protein] reductase
MDTGLRGQVVVVTGAQHGIGAATAKAFAAEGAAVFVHYFRTCLNLARTDKPEAPGLSLFLHRQSQPADAVVEEIRARGERAVAWECDLSQPANIEPLFDRAEAALGPVAILVNNAAYWQDDSFLPAQIPPANPFVETWKDRPPTITTEAYDRHFAVNARAVALLMAEYLRRYLARGATRGRIINVSTEGAHVFPGEVSYGASKAGMEAYTRSAACEFAKFGITANIVAPGPTQTGWITPELEQQVLPTIPAGRLGTPEDLADAIVLLASHQARWITGQTLHVGGGRRM